MSKPTIIEIIDGRWLEFALAGVVGLAAFAALYLGLSWALSFVVRDWRFR